MLTLCGKKYVKKKASTVQTLLKIFYKSRQHQIITISNIMDCSELKWL